tara:strand:- start:6646 stop:7431 length:786 start_codon:yes stop_codon:yes gene_type:complete
MKTWYNAIKKDNGVAVSILDEIGIFGISAESLISDIKAYEEIEKIDVTINSPGGSVFDGLAIYNFLKSHKAQVNIEVLGIAASSASVVAMAGDTITIPEDGFLMIHSPWSGAVGDAEEMRSTADVLDKIQETLINIYMKKTGLDRKEIEDMVNQETWLTGSEALELGFATHTNEMAIAALAKGMDRHFKKMPQALSKEKIDVSEIKNIRDFEKSLREAGVSRKDAVALASKKIEMQRDADHDEKAPESDAIQSLIAALKTK